MLPALNTILYATDLAPHGLRIFRHAVMLAQEHKARLVLLHALEPLGETATTLVRTVVPPDRLAAVQKEGLARVRDEIEQRLRSFCEQELGRESGGCDILSEIRIVEGSPAQVILDTAKAINADLIVMGMHGHTRLEYVLLGSVANRVINKSTVPVLLVPVEAAA